MSEVFKRRFFVVIHTIVNGLAHVLEQSELAREAGADGVFLIPDYAKGGKRATTNDQFNYIEELKQKMPNSFSIGVNFLSRPESLGTRIYDIQPDLYQTDSSSLIGIDKPKLSSTEFFVALAFKYSQNVHLTGNALREHCQRVCDIANVPTTSGDATGVEASMNKIREIRLYLPSDKRLGLASGVTEQNVRAYLQAGVTDFLVATSLIERVNEISGADLLSYKKINEMAEVIHSD